MGRNVTFTIHQPNTLDWRVGNVIAAIARYAPALLELGDFDAIPPTIDIADPAHAQHPYRRRGVGVDRVFGFGRHPGRRGQRHAARRRPALSHGVASPVGSYPARPASPAAVAACPACSPPCPSRRGGSVDAIGRLSRARAPDGRPCPSPSAGTRNPTLPTLETLATANGNPDLSHVLPET